MTRIIDKSIQSFKLTHIGDVKPGVTPDDRANVFLEAAESMVLKLDLEPMFFFLGIEENRDEGPVKMDMVFPAGQFFRNDDSKDMCASLMRKCSIELNPDAIVFITESWTVQTEETSYIEAMKIKKEHGSLEHVPGRMECITMVVQHKNGSAYVKNTEIVRDDQDNKIKIKPSEKSMPGYEGRFEIPRWDGVKETVH